MNIRVNPLEHVPASLKDWLAKPRPMLIDGKWVMAKSGKTFDVQDPATEQKLATVAEGDSDSGMPLLSRSVNRGAAASPASDDAAA